MSYVAIPSQLKNVDSVSLELMSPEEMINMSYGEVLTAETINYRTGQPQVNGLFCQAIFGPVRDFECACGKYKRYRYKGVICDRCGVEVTASSVRRERMAHISLAAPCVHPWFLRIIPSRIALMLDMKASDVSRVTYFSAYVITDINEEIRSEYLNKIDREAQARVKQSKSDFDTRFEELSRNYQKSKATGEFDNDQLKHKYEVDKELLKTQQVEMTARIETISEVAKKELQSLQYKDVITEVVYQELAQKFGPVFKAEIGAEAVEAILKNLNLEAEFEDVQLKLETAKGQSKKKLSKRYKLIKHFINNKTKPEWMILRRVMVLPPELRPMLQLDGGRFAASDLNELYRRLINRNNRLRKLIQIGAPQVILRNEKRMLQEAVEALIDNASRGGRQVMASTGIRRPLKSLTDILRGKQGRFRQNLLGKRVDYSGRSVIIVGPALRLDECGLPKEMALELFKPFLIGKIIQKSNEGALGSEDAFNVHSARRLIESRRPIVFDILDEVIKDKYVLLNRAPTLHRLSFLAFRPVLTEGKAIQLHPLVCSAFNADFDGDQMAVHLPITVKGQEEARDLMVAPKNLLKPASGDLIMSPKQDSVLGMYCLTIITKTLDPKKMKNFSSQDEAMLAYEKKVVEITELVRVKFGEGKSSKIVETTVGRMIFNNCFPADFEYFNDVATKKNYEALLDRAYTELGQDRLAKILDILKDTSFKYVTTSGVSLSAFDIKSPAGKKELINETRDRVSTIQNLFEFGLMTDTERYKQVVQSWQSTTEQIAQLVQGEMDEFGSVGMMIRSGSRGNNAQLTQMAGIRGLSITASGETIELPAQHGYIEGLTGLEYFIGMKGQRKALADVALRTADAGYLTRRLVDVAQNIIIMEDDCHTNRGVTIDLTSDDAPKRLYGCFLNRDVVFEGVIIAKRDDFIDRKLKDVILASGALEASIRVSMKCELQRGVCVKCYGMDFSNRQPVKLGVPIGIIAAQSLGEPATQLTMRSKHFGGVAMRTDITSGLPRVEELFEARKSKFIAPMATISGVIEKIEGNIDQGFHVTISSQGAIHELPYNSQEDTLLLTDGEMVSSKDVLLRDGDGQVLSAGVDGTIEVKSNSIVIKQTAIEIEEHDIRPGFSLKVKKGNRIQIGDPICEGPLELSQIIDLKGVGAVQEYIIEQLNDIYKSNGITVNEKHIEVILRQMCNRVEIVDPGESDYTSGDIVSYLVVRNLNKTYQKDKKALITYKRIITGISRASLSTESFLSAASFQETAKVLVEAVISGRKDYLLGLKENVILGQLIPAGTGFSTSKVKTAELQEEVEETDEVIV